MVPGLRNYLVVTGGYWAFTVTDGAIRMLVVLYFHELGYSPFAVAMLFLFYEFFGVVTNLVGGWLGSRIGLNLIMNLGMGLQVLALAMLTVPDPWLTVAYVMTAQALSGIAKDLNKMSAKASVKSLASEGLEARLFNWVAVLTGSKNALKGAGYFVGAGLLDWIGFRGSLAVLAVLLGLVLLLVLVLLPRRLGTTRFKARFIQVFSPIAAVNRLSAARFFLFGSRDVWFVVALPVYLYEILGWSFTAVGSFLAAWIIGYGIVQALSPRLLAALGLHASRQTAVGAVALLAGPPSVIALALNGGLSPGATIVVGLAAFGVLFAVNSAVHSYLILAYSDSDRVALNVGFYYMANAGGRLVGTVLSGLVYQAAGIQGCLWLSSLFLLGAVAASLTLPPLDSADDPGNHGMRSSGHAD